jgi:hypothetical protein
MSRVEDPGSEVFTALARKPVSSMDEPNAPTWRPLA